MYKASYFCLVDSSTKPALCASGTWIPVLESDKMNVCSLFSLDGVKQQHLFSEEVCQRAPIWLLGQVMLNVAHTFSALHLPSMLIPISYVTFSGLIMVLIAFIEY